MSNELAIKVENLSKRYKLYDRPVDRLKESLHPFGKSYSKDFYALKDISFEIKRGETVGIVGKNGAGKSTLLKILTGVLNPSSGKVVVNGKIAALLELGAGFNPEMTGLENIYLNGTIMGYSKEEIEEKLESVIEFADIGEFIHQQVKMYSSGMFARLAFSVAINVEPDILIVDEALSVGDAFFQQKCIHKMEKMKENGTTIFFVSHSIATVKALCRKAIYLSKGKLRAIGKTEEICTLYQNEMVSYDKKQNFKEIDLEKKKCPSQRIIDLKYFQKDFEFDKKITERSGSGEIKLTAFKIYDEFDNEISTIEVFKPIVMRLSHEVKKDVPAGATLGITCRTEMGIDVFGCNSNIYDIYLPELKVNEKFVYEVKLELPVLAGRYFFHMGIKPDQTIPYWYERCFGIGYIDVFLNNKLSQAGIGGITYANPQDIKIYKG